MIVANGKECFGADLNEHAMKDTLEQLCEWVKAVVIRLGEGVSFMLHVCQDTPVICIMLHAINAVPAN